MSNPFIRLFDFSNPAPIDLYNLKHLVLHGIPDQPFHLRPLVWDLLLGINSPNSPNSWSQSLDQRRHDYHELMSYFIQQLHPSVSESSSISSSVDQSLRCIHADISRTHSDLQFFSTSFRLPPDSLSASKLNLFICRLNQTQFSLNSQPNPHIPPPQLSSYDLFSSSPSFSSASSSPSSSSYYYSSSSQSKANSSLSSSTSTRTQSPPSQSTHLPTSFQSPHSIPTPQIHSINTLLEASSPLTPRLSLQAPSPINSPREQINSNVSFTYRDLLSRLLAVWSTLNPGIGYVQGMSDIAAVMVYVYSQSYHLPNRGQTHQSRQVLEAKLDYENLEADAFWAFTALVSNLRELFVNSFDGTSTKVESGFGKIFHQYSEQLDWLDSELSHHLRDLGAEGKFYVLNWLGCLFTRCFELPDLLRLWDSLLALNLDTHHASISINLESISINNDDGLINTLIDVCCALTIQLGPALKQQDSFDSIMKILQSVRTQNLSIEGVIKEVVIIRQRRLVVGLDPQSHQMTPPLPNDTPLVDHNTDALNLEANEVVIDNSTAAILGSSSWSGIGRLKSLAAHATQKIPSPSDIAVTQHIDPPETLGAGFFQKLKHTTEGWRDSDVAAEISKKATNWSIIASSWGTQSLITKLTNPNETSGEVLEPSPIPSFSPTNGRFMHPEDPNLHATQFSSAASSPQVSSNRWSKTSHTSNFSLDSPFQPPVSYSSGSISGSSSTTGSPINPNHPLSGIDHGPRPLLLSSRARTNVMTTPESGGKVHDMVNASIKRLSGFKLGMKLALANDELNNDGNHLHISSANQTSPKVMLASALTIGLHPSSSPSIVRESTTVDIFSRSRARSVLSSPIQHRFKGSSKPERVSLPNSIHGRNSNVELIQPSNLKSQDVGPIAIAPPRPIQSDDKILKENIKSNRSDKGNSDPFDDVVDEYVSFYDT